MFQSRSATTFRRGNARLWRRMSARLFQGQSAQRPPTDSVAVSPSKSAPMFLNSSVYRFPRLTARCLADNLAQKSHQETATRSPDVFALLSQRFSRRKSTTVNALLTRGMSVNQFPNRFATMSMSLAKSAMMSLKRFAKAVKFQCPSTLIRSSAQMLVPGSVPQLPDKSVLMLWSRFQGRLMRLSVRLNTFRSVPNLAMEG